MGAAGLAVDRPVRGRERPLGPVVDLVAYRVLQEALTNVHKHVTGTAGVTVDFGETSLSLTVANPAAGPRRPGGAGDRDHVDGLGLVGMREQVVALGPVLDAGPVTDALTGQRPSGSPRCCRGS